MAGQRDERPAAGGHVPVMAERVLALLSPALSGRGTVLVDATIGLGGHAESLLARHPQTRLIGLDRDPQALAAAGERLSGYGDRVRLVHAVYDALPSVLARAQVERVDGVLFDLGVSSLQLDDASRGFSYARDTRLDMRMDPAIPRTAEDIVNDYPPEQLTRVLREYGEERFAARIAHAIVRERTRARLRSSAVLAELVRDAVPAAARRTGGHPAKRTFQALRIEVNDELGALDRALPAAVAALRVGGRLVVLAYHSLEDRLVKRLFAVGSTTQAPPDLPIVPDSARPQLRVLTRGAERPTDEEIAANPRAASARLRAVERVRDAA